MKIFSDNKTEYYQNCGKCPKTRLSLNGKSDELLGERLKENYIDDFKCADCNNGTLCNSEKFIEEKLFCLERSINDSMFVKGARVCEEQCFVSRDNLTGYGSCLTLLLILNIIRSPPDMAVGDLSSVTNRKSSF